MMTVGNSWMALRISPKLDVVNEFGRPLFAHTRPIYLNGAGESAFRSRTARDTIREIELNLEVIEEQGDFASDTDREKVRSIYRQAITDLEARIDREGK